MRTLLFSLLSTVALLPGIHSFAQKGVAINTTGADAASSAMLDVSSFIKGVLIPRMTAAQRTAIASPATGLLVYQDDGTAGFYYYDGAAWTRLANGTGTVAVVNGGTGTITGSITGTTALTFTAGGSNQNVTLAPSGTGSVSMKGSTSINTAGDAPNGSAMLDVSSTSKGFLPPRMTSAQRNAISSPVEGLTIYNTDEKALNIYSGTSWEYANPFVCGQPFSDPRDGKVYNTVLIGTQCWMKENLNVGTMIDAQGYTVMQTDNGILEKYCYNNNQVNCTTYGGLYTWNEMMQYSTTPGVQGICPTGWHLPTDAEWTTLTTYLSSQPAFLCLGHNAKALAATTLWYEISNLFDCKVGADLTANNATGFTGLPGGSYDTYGYERLTFDGYWWSSSGESDFVWYRHIYFNSVDMERLYTYPQHPYSVRCLKAY